MYGKYHIVRAQSFYSAADAWTLSPDPGAGQPAQALATTQTVNAQGQVVSTGQLVRMSPIYQVLRIPGEASQSFNLLDAFVPVSARQPDPDPVRVHDRRVRPGPLRTAEDVRHATGQPGQRSGHRGRQDRRRRRRCPGRSRC